MIGTVDEALQKMKDGQTEDHTDVKPVQEAAHEA
jgi:hypothetical protein